MLKSERDGFTAGIYRNLERLVPILGRIADALEADKKTELAKAEPREQTLPGFAAADWMPPEIEAKKPREWCNTVKVWEILFDKLGCSHTTIEDILCDRKLWTKIAVFTKHKVHAGSFSRILSTLDRAGAATRVRGGLFSVIEPTDELREAVEQMAKKRAAAKEVSNG